MSQAKHNPSNHLSNESLAGTANNLPAIMTVREAAAILKISRWMVYQLMNKGELAYYHIGRLRRIPVEAVRDYQSVQLAKAHPYPEGL